MQAIVEILPIALAAMLVAASTILWLRTRRVSVLLQLIASCVVFVSGTPGTLAIVLVRFDYPGLYHTLRTSRADLVINSALALGILLFAVGYLSYALGHKRI